MGGGKQVWFALFITFGMIFLLTVRLLQSLWRGTPAFVGSKKDAPFLLLLLWCLIALKFPFSPPDALDSFLILTGCFFAFLLARTLSFEGLSVPLALFLSLAGAGYALIGVLQLGGLFPHSWWKPSEFVAATFVNHNHFAAYLELLLPLSFAIGIAAPLRPFQRFLAILSSVVMTIGLLLTNSRGSWLSIILASLVGGGWWLAGKRIKRITWNGIKIGCAMLFLVGTGFLIVQPPILNRLVSLLQVSSDMSFQMRLVMWKSTLSLLKENPLTGHGLDSFVFAFPRFRAPGLYRLVDFAHNEYLQIVAELGVIGLTLVILSGLVGGQRMVRLVRLSRTSWKQALGLGGLIGLAGLAVHSLGDFPWRLPAVAFQAAAVMGLVTGVQYESDPDPLRILRLNFSNSGSAKAMRWVFTVALVSGFILFSVGFSSIVWADLLAHQAKMFAKTRNSERTVGLYRNAIRLAPFRSAYSKNLGDQILRLANQARGYPQNVLVKEAVQAYQAALKLNPYDVWSAHGLGLAFRGLGNLEEGEHWLLFASNQDPQNPLFLKELAELQLIRGKTSEAAQAFLRSAQLAKPYHFFPMQFSKLDDPNDFIQRGESALLQGHAKYAENLFLMAQFLDPKRSEVSADLAMSLLNQGETPRAQELMNTVEAPELKAKWFSELGRWYWNQNKHFETGQAVEKALKLDPKNLLTRHLQLLLAKAGPVGENSGQALEALLSLNHPPVFLKRDENGKSMLVWEPEKGNYAEGRLSKEGWRLSQNGAIAERLALPPGNVRFEVRAWGTTVRRRGPIMVILWNGRPILREEVKEDRPANYGANTKIKAGESLLQIRFVNDLYDTTTQEDRNLMIDKIIVRWETD